MLSRIKSLTQKADRQLGGYFVATVATKAGEVECTAQQVPKLRSIHWRYNFKLDGKVIAASKLEGML